MRRLASRSQRERTGLFVAEGEDLVDAARDAGVEPVDLLVAGEDVTPALLAELSAHAHPSRVLAVFRRSDLPRGVRDVCVALWRVADPGNVGTLVRTADAFGASVALSRGCADPTGPKALRASAGAIFRVPLSEFEDAPRPRIALLARDSPPLRSVGFSHSTTFVLGAERDGLPDDVVAACEGRASIPQEDGAESLNVAIAGAIALYERARADSPR